MNFRTRQSDLEAEINLTPLIDVVFLLLIFFMITTTFSKEGTIKLRLPEATSAEKAEAEQNPVENNIEVHITEFGDYAIKGPKDKQTRELINASSRSLQRALQQAGETLTDPIVIIRADRRTSHEAVIQAMDAAKNQGFLQITFAVDKSEGR